ncbi:site-specific DNA-methyltransferase [Pediococcus pentosaceus]|uniref:site-specific DNA-methyltransferase n=1 Tax=Pediococcus pentosaceus TaxID=1255 RepID=UPI0018A1A3B2|nr:site-specific DNA-methyltransferase [Pediococcus pentosaceus]MBF7140643.1 site-specific DNA-methyltransferase [Pediococcus pentosaceus]
MEIEPKIMSQVKSILGEFGNKYLTSKGSLKRNNVINDLDKFDHELMTKLFKDPLIHKNYVEKIADTEVFKLNQFIEMFEYKGFWEDSYTKYTNKIGLTAGGKFIDESADVVLDFPFKDTVLKAGMTKEDQKDADEPFLHETIAKPEIDELLEPKIFVNATKYDKENLEGVSTDKFDDENLIIKGNNLIALHSIKEKYAGAVKLIYLDPPYNTGKDFGYNDKFNHSAWLTFIKSRLEIAWKLLSDNGTIWISIDDNESHYIKVLSDSIFGRQNFINEIVWQRAYAPVNLKKTFSKSHDYIEVYAKNNSSEKELNKLPRSAESDNRYKNPDNDPRGPWKADNFSVGPAIEKNIYKITTPSGRKVLPPSGRSWLLSPKRYADYIADNRIWFGKNGDNIPSTKRFLSEVKNGIIAQTLWTYEEVGHNQEAKKEIKMLFDGNSAFGTPKPERLLQRILTIGSNGSDIVLDFFMGSATTQAVAMKMNRRFIGIEQMDYIKTVSVERLKKVIAGEQGGISKDVNWQGGGSFVYAELMEKNQGYLKDLLAAKDMNELDTVYKRMKVGADFDFRVDLDKYENDAERKALPFEEQKQLLVKLLDKNQLYYNFNNIDDADVRDLISDKDYQFNQSFYGKRD